MRNPSAPELALLLRDACRRHGLRVTPQREAVYRELCRSDRHPTAEQLHGKIRKRYPHMSLDTVNRTLLTLARIGLAEVVEAFGTARRYDPNSEPHHHVHCLGCGSILDIKHPAYNELAIPSDIEREYDILTRRVVLSGYCPRCRRHRSKTTKLMLER